MQPMPDIDLIREVTLFLATCRTASLATHGDVGPHAANIQYVSDGALRLYWVSNPASLHSGHLAADPRAAVTIYSHTDAPDDIHGLQMRGTVAEVSGLSEWGRVWEMYSAKFPFVASAPKLIEAVRSQKFYAFTPTWLRWIDNRRGFGFKVEKQL